MHHHEGLVREQQLEHSKEEKYKGKSASLISFLLRWEETEGCGVVYVLVSLSWYALLGYSFRSNKARDLTVIKSLICWLTRNVSEKTPAAPSLGTRNNCCSFLNLWLSIVLWESDRFWENLRGTQGVEESSKFLDEIWRQYFSITLL